MDKSSVIETKIRDFIKKDRSFTSVDIANAIKEDGIWIRNIEVRDWLKSNIQDSDIFGEYESELIEVCSGTRTATLYRPSWADSNDYDERDQIALTPDQVNAISSQDKKPSTSKKNNSIKDTADDEDIITMVNPKGVDIRRTIYSTERIKIPGVIIKKLGLRPGDNVNPMLLKTHRPVPSRLKVNSDYRVSIPRDCVNWGNDPINVMLKGKEIIFEKA